MPARLTPTQALDPDTIERLAAAEFTYDSIMSGRWDFGVEWFALRPDADEWRAKARELLTGLVNETPYDQR